LLVAFALWKIFIAPRNLDLHNAQPAPHATYARLDGGTFSVVEERGHLLFLDFYASWCEPCKVEAPMVEKWARENPNAEVVPVDVGEPAAVARAFAHQYDLHNVALDPSGNAQALFDVQGFPTVIVIDSSGRIRAKWPGLNPAIALAMSNAQKALGDSR
jgi:cytochrome c biogenesis protein CcmG/thiol:disulfide interchange protein DsbE